MTHERIVVDQAIMAGKPVIRGTRLPVETILRELGWGASFETLKAEYDVSVEEIRAALAYAAEHLSSGTAEAA